MAREELVYRSLLENHDFVVFRTDREGLVTYISPAAERITGYRPDEIAGRHFGNFVHQDDLPALKAGLQNTLQGFPEAHEFRAWHRNGSLLWLRGSSLAEVDDGAAIGIIGIFSDLTAHHLTELALGESEDRYRDLVEHSQDLVCTHDLQGRLLSINPAPARLLGYSIAELLQIPMRELVAPAFRTKFDHYLERIAENGSDNGYLAVLSRTGQERVWEYRNTLRTEGVSSPIVRGMAHDITERHLAERALHASEERFRVALNGSPITVFNQDKNLRYTWIYNSQTGRPESEYLGRTDGEMFAPEEAAQLSQMKRQVLETGVGMRQQVSIVLEGKRCYFDLNVEPRREGGRVEGIICSVINITDLREKTDQLRDLNRRLAEEKLYLEDELEAEYNFGRIVGSSEALKRALARLKTVAATNSTVLITGETGTGKELVARAIHASSPRKHNSFIKINCAAVPTGLLESELFGYEKGAFTHATSQKLGRMELAHKGTFFLDEVGDIPLEIQPKLLRALEDQEFERLGSSRTIKVDVRLIAATNHDLSARVRERKFREDLFYRLNVFPIRMPPLRERREDIPLLVRHFVSRYAARFGKTIESISAEALQALSGWDWPGNVRELENFIERSVILSRGPTLAAPLSELKQRQEEPENDLKAAERRQIIKVLKECRGRISGAKGAAARLGLNRTTLYSRLQRLGISRRDYTEQSQPEDD
jgi:PAS domain S-box-containing protein